MIKGIFLIFLIWILYITVTFPFPKTTVFWITFGFCVPVLWTQIFTLQTVCRQDILMKDRALDFPRLRIVVFYSVIQFAASLFLMGFSERVPVYAAVFIETTILLIAVVGFYAVRTACKEVISQNARRQDNTANLQRFQEQLNRLMLHCENEQIQKGLCKLIEEMRFCNPTSTENAQEIENEIAILLNEIEDVSLSQDADMVFSLCERMTGLLKERDRICKNKG